MVMSIYLALERQVPVVVDESLIPRFAAAKKVTLDISGETVAADDDVHLIVKGHLFRRKVAEALACQATENHGPNT